MYRIGGETIWCGDFHGQWCEAPASLPLNLAALSICGHDFSLFNSGDTSPAGPFHTLVKQLGLRFLVLPYGRELMYPWAHVMVGGLQPDAQVPGLSNPDFIAVLKELRTMCDFISVAHPYRSFLQYLDDLLDEKIVDSVAFLEPDVPEYMNWYQSRIARGKKMPIVAELDFHVTKGRRNGLIQYQTAAEAEQDLPPVASKTTLVFAEELTTEAIYAAVRAGRSCVDLGNRLFGTPELIRLLEKNDYWEQKAAAQKKRESLRVELGNGVVPLEGEPFHLTVTAGERRWIREMTAPVNTSGAERFFLAVKAGNQCRSIQISSAQKARILPGFRADGTGCIAVEITNSSMVEPAGGELVLEVNRQMFRQSYSGLLPGGKRSFRFHVPEEWLKAEPPIPASLVFKPERLPERVVKRSVICVGIRYSGDLSEADWAEADPIRLNRRDQLETQWSDHWGGPEDSSADIRMLWNENALYLRAEITDSVLAPTHNPDFLFMGDALQIGINPFDNPAVNAFSFYHFLATRGGQPDHDEFCLVSNVPEGTERIHRTLPFRLPKECYRLILHEHNRSTLELAFPWDLLPLIVPRPGSRFQLHFILWDNDGSGLKASLHWPHPETAWYLPSDAAWGSAELLCRRTFAPAGELDHET